MVDYDPVFGYDGPLGKLGIAALPRKRLVVEIYAVARAINDDRHKLILMFVVQHTHIPGKRHLEPVFGGKFRCAPRLPICDRSSACSAGKLPYVHLAPFHVIAVPVGLLLVDHAIPVIVNPIPLAIGHVAVIRVAIVILVQRPGVKTVVISEPELHFSPGHRLRPHPDHNFDGIAGDAQIFVPKIPHSHVIYRLHSNRSASHHRFAGKCRTAVAAASGAILLIAGLDSEFKSHVIAGREVHYPIPIDHAGSIDYRLSCAVIGGIIYTVAIGIARLRQVDPDEIRLVQPSDDAAAGNGIAPFDNSLDAGNTRHFPRNCLKPYPLRLVSRPGPAHQNRLFRRALTVVIPAGISAR